jgi:hypothetical protein
LRLALLAPDIIRFASRWAGALMVEHLERRLQASWETQGDLREILQLFSLGKRAANKSDG